MDAMDDASETDESSFNTDAFVEGRNADLECMLSQMSRLDAISHSARNAFLGLLDWHFRHRRDDFEWYPVVHENDQPFSSGRWRIVQLIRDFLDGRAEDEWFDILHLKLPLTPNTELCRTKVLSMQVVGSVGAGTEIGTMGTDVDIAVLYDIDADMSSAAVWEDKRATWQLDGETQRECIDFNANIPALKNLVKTLRGAYLALRRFTMLLDGKSFEGHVVSVKEETGVFPDHRFTLTWKHCKVDLLPAVDSSTLAQLLPDDLLPLAAEALGRDSELVAHIRSYSLNVMKTAFLKAQPPVVRGTIKLLKFWRHIASLKTAFSWDAENQGLDGVAEVVHGVVEKRLFPSSHIFTVCVLAVYYHKPHFEDKRAERLLDLLFDTAELLARLGSELMNRKTSTQIRFDFRRPVQDNIMTFEMPPDGSDVRSYLSEVGPVMFVDVVDDAEASVTAKCGYSCRSIKFTSRAIQELTNNLMDAGIDTAGQCFPCVPFEVGCLKKHPLPSYDMQKFSSDDIYIGDPIQYWLRDSLLLAEPEEINPSDFWSYLIASPIERGKFFRREIQRRREVATSIKFRRLESGAVMVSYPAPLAD